MDITRSWTICSLCKVEQIKKLAIVIPAYKGVSLKRSTQLQFRPIKDEFVLYIGDDTSPERLDKIVESYQNKANLVYHRLAKIWGQRFGGPLGEVYPAVCRAVYPAFRMMIWCRLMVWNVSWRFCRAHTISEDIFVSISCHWWWKQADTVPIVLWKKEVCLLPAAAKISYRKSIGFGCRKYVFSRGDMAVNRGFVHFPIVWCSDDATWAAFARHAGGVISLPGQPVCWRNVEGANISNSAGQDKDKLHATILFSWDEMNMFSDYVDDPSWLVHCNAISILSFVFSIVINIIIYVVCGYLWSFGKI